MLTFWRLEEFSWVLSMIFTATCRGDKKPPIPSLSRLNPGLNSPSSSVFLPPFASSLSALPFDLMAFPPANKRVAVAVVPPRPAPGAHLFPSQDVPSQLHLGEVTLADGLKESVVADVGLLVSRGS